ncbi:hypothetical protein SCUCBS95973_005437 [Sporothrix curviconia]|uniref:Uncharacterized protein n=1 Tax=Sporothrix curviconia TaxID=1260050 RepID=A0ABP0BX11_9PEZI
MANIHELSQLTLDFVNDPSTSPEDRALLQRAAGTAGFPASHGCFASRRSEDAAGTAIVSIQFVWMAKQTGAADAWRQELRIDAGDGDAWVAQQRSRPPYGPPGDGHDDEHDQNNHKGIVAAVHAQTGRPLRSGSMASVVLPSLSDALDMKAMLDLQWACIRLASMSGAAGSDDFLDADEFEGTFRESVLTRDAQRE